MKIYSIKVIEYFKKVTYTKTARKKNQSHEFQNFFQQFFGNLKFQDMLNYFSRKTYMALKR